MNSHRHSLAHSARSFRHRAVLIGALLLLGGCAKKESSSAPQSEPRSSTPSNSASPSSQTGGPATRGLTEAEIRYGVSPTRNDSHFVYEDNVVIVEHGAEAIHSLSSNGLTWAIDANAPHADEIKPGKIVFLTSRAVGRVLSAERKGSDLAVIFGPVELTDVFKEAHVPIDEPIDLDSMITSSAPDYPGTDALPETSQLVAPPYGWSASRTGRIPIYGDQPRRQSLETVNFGESVPAAFGSGSNLTDPSHLSVAVFPPRGAADLVAFAQDQSPQAKPREIEVKDLKLTPFCCGGLGMRASYLKNGLQFNAESALQLDKPAVVGRLEILPGKRITAELELKGAAGYWIQVVSSSSAGVDWNIFRDIAIPIDIWMPLHIVAGGPPIPLNLTFRQHFIIKTQFSAKNSAMKAGTQYKIKGSIRMGFRDGSFTIDAPIFAENHGLVASIRGLSLGANALPAIALQGKVIVGIGAFGFVTGPFVGYNFSAGIVRGSDQGFAVGMVQTCRAADLAVSANAGIGYAMPRAVTKAINFFLRALNLGEVDGEGGVTPLKKELLRIHDAIPTNCA
jgi:hypothetical protein